MAPITQERLKQVLNYDPETGVFTWRVSRFKARAGVVAGRVNWKGYRLITVDYNVYRAHRLAWLYHYGFYPSDDCIDHVDQNKSNNSIVNLRLATDAENKINHKLFVNNTSGYTGVSFNKKAQKWGVKVSNKHFGYYENIEDAVTARDIAARRIYGEFVPEVPNA